MAAAGNAVTSRSLRLFSDLVEAQARRCSAYASRPAKNDLVRAFRGGATPGEPVGKFLDRIYCAGAVEGTCFVLAGVYLLRFFCSPAAIEARIRMEPTTAHRLAAIALFVGAKFDGHPHRKWTPVFEICSGRVISAGEMAALEHRFLRAIDYRLYVRTDEFESFVRLMEAGGEEDERRRIRPCLPNPAIVPAI